MPRGQLAIVCPCGWRGCVPRGPIVLCPRCGGTEWRGETNAETLKRLREAAVARGDCYVCRCRPAKPGGRECQSCIDRAGRYQASIAYRWCQNCGVDVRRRKTLLCAACTKKASAIGRRMTERRNACGLCARCGKRPLLPGHTACRECLDETRDRQLAGARKAGRKPRSCPVCRELGIDGTGHDRRTHDRWMERRKAWAA